MNDEYLKKLSAEIESTIPDDCIYYSNPYDSDAILYAVQKAWQAACEYKDMQLINGSKMKQMNDRIEELLAENKKLRKIIHDLVITGMDIDMAERLEEIDEE